MESPQTSTAYALEDPATAKAPSRRKRVLLIATAVVVAIAAIVVIVVVATHSSSSSDASSNSSSSDDNNAASSSSYVCDSVKQDAGYVTLPDKRDGHYFYWYFESRRKPSEDPLVLWLTGGPGCSSLWAMLAENGPCQVKPDLSTQKNPYSWNANANVVWLDQPTFTGYSYGQEPDDEDKDSNDVAKNLYDFFQAFYAKHPDLRSRDLYITGESYAGHYIPVSSHYIWKQNTFLTSSNASKRINLKGIAIGNGLTAATIQYEHYLDMANNTYGIQLYSSAERLAQGRSNAAECVSYIQACQSGGTKQCIQALNYCYDYMESALDFTDRNPYDIRQKCTQSNAVDCYDSTSITKFLNSEKIQTYLKIPEDKVPTWIECNNNVSYNFIYSGDYLGDHQNYIAELLDGSDIRVLIYAGDADTVCNWFGNYAWTKELDWGHKAEFNAAKERDFVTSNGTKAGILRSYGTQFTFLRVFESGHMVPMDQPAVALEMLVKFMANATL